MSSLNGEEEIILGFIFEAEDNLALALKIAKASDDIRKRILLKFFNGLEEKLKKELSDEWNVANEFKTNVYDRYCGIYISKKLWGENYSIELIPDKYNARDFYIGIYKEKDLPLIGQGKLRGVLDEFFGVGGNPHKEYEWWRSLDSPYREFIDNDTLIKLQFTDEVELYFFNMFMRIRELSESLIDDALAASNR